MNLLLIYFGLVILLVGFSLLAVFSFWRYRFKGDRTLLIIVMFYVTFALIMGSTLFLLNPSALSQKEPTGTVFDPFS